MANCIKCNLVECHQYPSAPPICVCCWREFKYVGYFEFTNRYILWDELQFRSPEVAYKLVVDWVKNG